MTQSKARAKVHDVLVKTGPGIEDFGYIPLGQVKVNGVTLAELIDQTKADASKRLDVLEKESLEMKKENQRLEGEVRKTLDENKSLLERLDKLETVFEKNIREWLTR